MSPKSVFSSVPLTALVAAALAASAPAQAQQYPSKIVRVIVPFAPGGGSDISARRFSAKLSESLGQQFVVDNRGGAAGLIGMELTSKAPPDGYTVMIMSGSFSATSATAQPKFDPINTIIPVVEFGATPFVLTVHPVIPAKSVKELVALARAKPGDLTYANTGIGGMTHLATEYFLDVAKIKMVGVPYKSTGAGMADILSGQVPIIVGSLLPVVPHLKTGRIRALGVGGVKRSALLPDVPTVAESGLDGYQSTGWRGIMGPAGIPAPIAQRLAAEVKTIVSSDEVKTHFLNNAMEIDYRDPKDFAVFIADEIKR